MPAGSDYLQAIYGDSGKGPDSDLIQMIERDCVDRNPQVRDGFISDNSVGPYSVRRMKTTEASEGPKQILTTMFHYKDSPQGLALNYFQCCSVLSRGRPSVPLADMRILLFLMWKLHVKVA